MDSSQLALSKKGLITSVEMSLGVSYINEYKFKISKKNLTGYLKWINIVNDSLQIWQN